MIFTIDAGNMYIVMGGIENEKTRFVCRLSTDKNKTGDEYAVLFKNILDIRGVDLSSLDGAIISSVVPSLTASLKSAVRTVIGKTPMVVGPGIKTGLNILLDNPGQMGGDIVTGAVAALAKYPLPCVTVAMSTAATIGILDKNGSFIGGAICPGIAVSMEALTENTEQLPGISLETPRKVIGRSTVECMQSGLIYGAASMLDGMLNRIEDELGERPTAVFTGTAAQELLPHCRREGIIYDKDLILRGLWLIYMKNTGK